MRVENMGYRENRTREKGREAEQCGSGLDWTRVPQIQNEVVRSHLASGGRSLDAANDVDNVAVLQSGRHDS